MRPFLVRNRGIRMDCARMQAAHSEEKTSREWSDKPGSVSPGHGSPREDDHLSRTLVAQSLKQPTRV